jgi:hypothetical protein
MGDRGCRRVLVVESDARATGGKIEILRTLKAVTGNFMDKSQFPGSWKVPKIKSLVEYVI